MTILKPWYTIFAGNYPSVLDHWNSWLLCNIIVIGMDIVSLMWLNVRTKYWCCGISSGCPASHMGTELSPGCSTSNPTPANMSGKAVAYCLCTCMKTWKKFLVPGFSSSPRLLRSFGNDSALENLSLCVILPFKWINNYIYIILYIYKFIYLYISI